jgi:hypothetical protein
MNFDAAKLILIAGLPRSGTSWLGKIFDSHPDTAYRSEPDNFPHLDEVPPFADAADSMRYRTAVQAFAQGLARVNDYRHAAKPPLFSKSYRSAPGYQFFRAAAFGARLGTRINRNWPVPGARVDGVRPPPVMVWKSIRGLGRTAILLDALPGTKFIHLLRHPCGHIASVLRGERESGFPSRSSEYYGIFKMLCETPQGRRRGLTVEVLRRLTSEERLAWQWVLVNEKALEEGAGRAHAVRYEDLCADPPAVARTLFTFAGLEWHAQTQAFIQASTSGGNQRYFSVFKNPARSANRWRHELDSVRIDRILAVVAESPALAPLYDIAAAPMRLAGESS